MMHKTMFAPGFAPKAEIGTRLMVRVDSVDLQKDRLSLAMDDDWQPEEEMSQPIFHTVITNPEHGGGLEPGSTTHAQTGSRLPPDPGKPSLAQRPCLYLTCFVKFRMF